MDKSWFRHNRNWFVFVMCSIWVIIALIGVTTTFAINENYLGDYVMFHNMAFCLFWGGAIVVENSNTKFHKWLNSDKNE